MNIKMNPINKLSLRYLTFMIICIFGCIYHIVQISKVYFLYSTNVNVYVDFKGQIKVPMLSLCRWTDTSLKRPFVNETITPQKLYKRTFDFSHVFFNCEISVDGFYLKEYNCTDLGKFGIQMKKMVNDIFVCYVLKHPQFNKNVKRRQGIIYRIYFHQLNNDESWLFLSSDNHNPSGRDWNTFKLSSKLHYMLSYSQRTIHLLPIPYQTKCINYEKIGFRSKSDCIDQCNINLNLAQCKALPSYVTVNISEFGDEIYNRSSATKLCKKNINSEFCDQKCHYDECLIKINSISKIEDYNLKSIRGYNINSLTLFEFVAANEPDTHYIHSPHQLFVEYICYVAGVISLWTGFSILSIYSFAKRFWINKNIQVDHVKDNSLDNNRLYHYSGKTTNQINQIRILKRRFNYDNPLSGKSIIHNQRF